LLLLSAEALWYVNSQLVPGVQPEAFFPSPTSTKDYILMVIKYAGNGFAEELVVRAYLITRLQHLLRSRILAVIISAVMFASYHLYAGLADVSYFLMFGILFGICYLAVQRIWPVALGHMLWDIRADLVIPA
jgi:membrane protease YdiL (CAAX protease family)